MCSEPALTLALLVIESSVSCNSQIKKQALSSANCKKPQQPEYLPVLQLQGATANLFLMRVSI